MEDQHLSETNSECSPKGDVAIQSSSLSKALNCKSQAKAESFALTGTRPKVGVSTWLPKVKSVKSLELGRRLPRGHQKTHFPLFSYGFLMIFALKKKRFFF